MVRTLVDAIAALLILMKELEQHCQILVQLAMQYTAVPGCSVQAREDFCNPFMESTLPENKRHLQINAVPTYHASQLPYYWRADRHGVLALQAERTLQPTGFTPWDSPVPTG